MYGDLRYVERYWGRETAAHVRELMMQSPKIGGVALYEEGHFKFKVLWFEPANFTAPFVLYPEPSGRAQHIELLDHWETLFYLTQHREAARTEFRWRYSYPSQVSYVAEVALKSALARMFGLTNIRLDDLIAVSRRDRFVIFASRNWDAGIGVLATPQSWMILTSVYRYSADLYGGLVPASVAARDFAPQIEMLRNDRNGCLKVISSLAFTDVAFEVARCFSAEN